MKWVQSAVLFFLLASFVSAHAHQDFKIGDKTYSFTIGSLNEPVVVGDKSGIDLRVKELRNRSGNLSEIPIEGLEKTLKMEVITGSERQEWSIQAAYGSPGSYKNTIYFNEAVPIAYRVFGSIVNIPFDVTFECDMEGAGHGSSDNTPVRVSDQVTRISKASSFGCPKEQSGFSFPGARASYQYLFNAMAIAGLLLGLWALKKH